MAGPLSGTRILDLSRVLAGPWAGQVLADLGADVIKVERRGVGDDTRGWGPPYLKDEAGKDSRESGYYLSANRGKRSIERDFNDPADIAIVKTLAARSDVLLENFKGRVMPQVVSPMEFANQGLSFTRVPPKLGEHTAEILAEIEMEKAQP